jgi:small multidrug resistance family-3 protein
VKSISLFCIAAILEIAGCFSFYAWLRQQRSPLWLLCGIPSLIVFAFLTRIESAFAGRAYPAYRGICILASLLWLWAVEGSAPDRSDVLGAVLCLCGAGIILFVPRLT